MLTCPSPPLLRAIWKQTPGPDGISSLFPAGPLSCVASCGSRLPDIGWPGLSSDLFSVTFLYIWFFGCYLLSFQGDFLQYTCPTLLSLSENEWCLKCSFLWISPSPQICSFFFFALVSNPEAHSFPGPGHLVCSPAVGCPLHRWACNGTPSPGPAHLPPFPGSSSGFAAPWGRCPPASVLILRLCPVGHAAARVP